MKFKGILLDIDNTVYDYDAAHNYGFNQAIVYCENTFHFNKAEILGAFKSAREKVHLELKETASSHNRLLYFQKMLEILQVSPLEYSMKIYNVYWDNFLNKMTPFDGIYELLEKYKNKICLITDLTAHIQFRKVKQLNLDSYCRAIVTSEEAGKEKPHPYVFMMALLKLGLKSDQVCMIGDSLKKDILGASNLGIKSIWLSSDSDEKTDSRLVTKARNINEIIELI